MVNVPKQNGEHVNTLIVGDLHLKQTIILPLLESIIEKESIGRIIFVGDYVDAHHQQMNLKLYAKQLIYMDNWRNQKMAEGIEIIMLAGNHDVPIITGDKQGFSVASADLFYAINDIFLKWQLRVAYKLGNYLVSHAGYNQDFDLEEWQLQPITPEHYGDLIYFSRTVGHLRMGSNYLGSMIWADYSEMLYLYNSHYPLQIFGHTAKSEIAEIIDDERQLLDIDTFDVQLDEHSKWKLTGNGEVLLHDGETGRLKILRTNWQSENTINQVNNMFIK